MSELKKPSFANPPGVAARPGAAKARGPITPEDAPDVLASSEPDDDLQSLIPAPDPDYVSVAERARLAAEQLPEIPAPAPLLPSSLVEGSTLPATPGEAVLEAQRNLARAMELANPDVPYVPPTFEPGTDVLIHIREDGFTANGRVWYRGQEIEYTVGDAAWRDTCDNRGQSWLLLSESDQIRRYTKVMFGIGPWPGEAYNDPRVLAAEAARARRAPRIDTLSARTRA